MADINKNNESTINNNDAIFVPAYSPIINKLIDEIDFQFPSGSDQATQEEFKTSCKEFMLEMVLDKKGRLRALNGIDIALSNLKRVSNAPLCEEELRGAAASLLEKGIAFIENNQEAVIEKLKTGKTSIPIKDSSDSTLMEKMGISDPTFASIYEIGCQLFNEDRLEEAASIFETLTMINGLCSEAWFSAALCNHRLKDWIQAIAYYNMAIQTDALNIQAFINLAICFAELSNQEQVEATLAIAEEVVKSSSLDEEDKANKIASISDARTKLGR